MHLDQLADDFRLNLAVPEIAEQVEQVSGKGIDFRPDPKLGVSARTKMARRRMAQHVILFNPRNRSHLSHLLAHECTRIWRMFAAPPDERRVPASTLETLRVARGEIREEAQFLPRDLRDEMIDRWIHGLITQATSQPVDVRIEKWIGDNYPSLRKEQRRFLRTEARAITANISPDVKRTTPDTVFKRSNALNYAYLEHVGAIIERSFESKFQSSPEIASLGSTLSRVMDNDDLSDQELVNRVTETIQVRHWFTWLNFEDMPESYYVS